MMKKALVLSMILAFGSVASFAQNGRRAGASERVLGLSESPDGGVVPSRARV